MSIESFVRRRAVVLRAGILVVAACFTVELKAAETDFRPTMTFGVFHTGNIAVIGDKTVGDDGASLAFDLAWDRKTPTSIFSFSYRPSYIAYRQSTDANYFGNTIVLGFARDSSLASRFSVDAYVSRTDNQGQTADTADRATTYVPRTTVTRANVRVGGTVGAGRRGFFDWQVRAGADRYKDVKDDPDTLAVNESHDFNDSTDAGARIAWRGELSVRNSLGAALDVAGFRYEITPSVVVESIGLVGTCQAGASWLLDYSAGVSHATSGGVSIDGFSYEAKIAYALGKTSTFSAGVRQVFAPGTGLTGPTQDRGGWVSYGHTPTAWGLSGSVVGGYWQRDELQFTSAGTPEDRAAITVNGVIGWKFNRFLALDWSYAFIDQSARNGSPDTLNTSYSSYGLFLRWAIRGR